MCVATYFKLCCRNFQMKDPLTTSYIVFVCIIIFYIYEIALAIIIIILTVNSKLLKVLGLHDFYCGNIIPKEKFVRVFKFKRSHDLSGHLDSTVVAS